MGVTPHCAGGRQRCGAGFRPALHCRPEACTTIRRYTDDCTPITVEPNARSRNSMMSTNAPAPVHPDARIGHVHLKVSDLDRAIAFYHGVLGFDVTQRWGQAAFL